MKLRPLNLARPGVQLYACLCVLLLSLCPAGAIIDASVQMLLGNPSNATADPNNHTHYLIQRSVEAIDYNDSLGEPNWASWNLTAGDVGTATRSQKYLTDTNLPATFYRVTDNDYIGVGAPNTNLNRGHMCPSEDRTDTEDDNDMVFFMSNIIPQAADNNQGVWANFEAYCREVAKTNELLIICGPYGFTDLKIPSGKAYVPQYVWKIAVCVSTNGPGNALARIDASTRVIALKTPNTNGLSHSMPWQPFVTSVNQIQSDTGYTFFTALPADVAAVLRAKVDGQPIPAPAIGGFSPNGGPPGTPVVITGSNFDSTTNVSFNGTSASFVVDSPTQISTTVPVGAVNGPILVATGGGTAVSASNFVVSDEPVPDLMVSLTHTGTFTQGDPADVYTLVVTNAGTGASSGTVTLTDTLPAGLTATAVSGSGWSVNLGTLTCTRSDALASGATYPPVTLTVSVSPSAAASLTNLAGVSGGGDSILLNNNTSDPTSIQAASAPSVTTGAAGSIGDTSVVLNGTVNPHNQPETAWFEYGLSTSYGSTGMVSGTLTGNTLQPVSSSLSGLAPGTTYHYRMTATNLLGAATGLDQTFTTDSSGGGSGLTTLAGWDVSTLTGGSGNFGPSPLAPTTNAANLSVGGLTRGSGVGTSNTGGARGWGGNGFTDTSSTAAISANRFMSFASVVNAGYKVSYTAISRFDYRRSNTGPTNGLVQFQIGSGAFNDIAAVSYIAGTNNGGASLGPIDLTGFAALQNVSEGTPITFRIVNWGGGSGGTWYIYDRSNSPATDFELQGTVSPTVASAPDLAVSVTHTGSFTQGNVGDTCTITVTNLGAAATVGTVSVSDVLPAGLTATAIGGPGWASDLGTLTCTRSDALAAGAAYPAITVTVDVATNAPPALTNLVAVSGGGDATPDNNSASDVLSIISLTPLQAWRAYWFGTTADSGLAADGAIQTSDGLPNLVKYALGLDPLVPATNPVVGDIATGYLRLSSPKNPDATDVLFTVEASSDVQSGWSTNGTVVDKNSATQLEVHDATPVGSASQRFLRLRISRP